MYLTLYNGWKSPSFNCVADMNGVGASIYLERFFFNDGHRRGFTFKFSNVEAYINWTPLHGQLYFYDGIYYNSIAITKEKMAEPEFFDIKKTIHDGKDTCEIAQKVSSEAKVIFEL